MLALARQSWLGEMTSRLEALGYPDYRRTDAAAMRLLMRGPAPVGRIGVVLGVTRQAARKAIDGLEQRGYATATRDLDDARQLNIALTPVGRDYAQAITAVVAELNREVSRRTDPAQLAAADAVLRAALFDESARQRASRLPHPPSPGEVPPDRDLLRSMIAAASRLRALARLVGAVSGDAVECARRNGRQPAEARDDAGPLEQAAVVGQQSTPVTVKFTVWTQPRGPSASELTGCRSGR